MKLSRNPRRRTLNRCRRTSKRRTRDGAVVVELAIVVPLILLFTISTLEICEGFFLKQKALIAAYEGARAAVGRDGTRHSVEESAAKYLDARNLQYTSISEVVSISANPASAAILTPITVKVEIDFDTNSRMPAFFYKLLNGDTIASEVTLQKEFANN